MSIFGCNKIVLKASWGSCRERLPPYSYHIHQHKGGGVLTDHLPAVSDHRSCRSHEQPVWSSPSSNYMGTVHYGKGYLVDRAVRHCLPHPVSGIYFDRNCYSQRINRALNFSRKKNHMIFKLVPSWDTLCFIDFSHPWAPTTLKSYIASLRMFSYTVLNYQLIVSCVLGFFNVIVSVS